MSAPVRNVLAAFDRIPDPWQPHRLVSVNDQDVKIARLRGEFVWHSHPDSDELFLVVDGHLTLQLRGGDVELGPNDVYVVPAGVEHCPRADTEALVVMVERQGTVNTGDNPGERTTEVRELMED